MRRYTYMTCAYTCLTWLDVVTRRCCFITKVSSVIDLVPCWRSILTQPHLLLSNHCVVCQRLIPIHRQHIMSAWGNDTTIPFYFTSPLFDCLYNSLKTSTDVPRTRHYRISGEVSIFVLLFLYLVSLEKPQTK